MLIKQFSDCSITIRRLDTGENITIALDDVIDVDNETAKILIGLNGTVNPDNGVESNIIAI